MNFSKFNWQSCTVSSASPAVITAVEHELAVDDEVWFEATAIPTGMVADTTYYVINNGITANTFQISLTKRGTAVNTSSTGTTVTYQKQNRARLTPVYENNK
jgi:hypothetical protein